MGETIGTSTIYDESDISMYNFFWETESYCYKPK